MLSKQLKTTGTVLMHEGRIYVDGFGFDADDCTCREVAGLALVWAIGEMQRELSALIAEPGGGEVSVDLPEEVRTALNLPDPWDDEDGAKQGVALMPREVSGGR